VSVYGYNYSVQLSFSIKAAHVIDTSVIDCLMESRRHPATGLETASVSTSLVGHMTLGIPNSGSALTASLSIDVGWNTRFCNH
jgi:hypothetical protein